MANVHIKTIFYPSWPIKMSCGGIFFGLSVTASIGSPSGKIPIQPIFERLMEEYLTEWTDKIIPWFLNHGVRILVILVCGYLIHKLIVRFIIRVIRLAVTRDRHQSEAAETMRENTLIRIFTWSLTVIVILVTSMMIMQELSIPIGPVLAGAGIVGLAVGFGGQYLIKDIISGFFIILENQYRIGDSVTIDQTSGTVEDISLRMTTLRDMNGTVHHIPHSDIKRVSNQSKQFGCVNLNVRIAAGNTLDDAIRVINQTGLTFAEDPAWKNQINKAPQFLRVEELHENAIVLKITGETSPSRQWAVTGELRKRLKEAFEREGILMPITEQRVTIIRTGEHPDQD